MRALKKFAFLVLALATFALTGCDKLPTAPSYEPKTVLFGYLYVGEAITPGSPRNVSGLSVGKL